MRGLNITNTLQSGDTGLKNHNSMFLFLVIKFHFSMPLYKIATHGKKGRKKFGIRNTSTGKFTQKGLTFMAALAQLRLLLSNKSP
jgi:hypothetical protein